MRSALHRKGLRFRVDKAPLKGLRRRADIVFGPAKVAVFIDGCFWHGCPLHATQPKANEAWWRQKLEANRKRDQETDRKLSEAGWTVIRAWAHEDPAAITERVERLAKRRPATEE